MSFIIIQLVNIILNDLPCFPQSTGRGIANTEGGAQVSSSPHVIECQTSNSFAIRSKHSVLKDKVRDLEQMTENEEKQIKSKIADSTGEHIVHSYLTTCPNASADLSCAEHREYLENKYCHRRDGQCVCYYCTIFGHTVYMFLLLNKNEYLCLSRIPWF